MKETNERIYNVLPNAKIGSKNFHGFWYSSSLALGVGDLVQVPLGGRKSLGVVTEEVHEKTEQKLKPITELLVPGFMNKERMELLEWFSSYYRAPRGLSLHLFLTGYSHVTRKVTLKNVVHSTEKHKKVTLNTEQKKAVSEIASCFQQKKFEKFLLFGPTGSGKTEVYLRACEENIANKKQAIIFVPEIALTPQTVSRFASRFPDKVHVYHSKMTPAQKRKVVEAVLEDETAIVVGPRSALFLPYKNLGLMVLDEEHDSSFQQLDQNPHFDARLVATKYAELLGIPVIFGDATPEIELFYEATQPKPRVKLLQLHKRISESSQDIPFPKVAIVDLVQEIRAGNRSPFSNKLVQDMYAALKNKEQVFLFLNRRGLASSVVCVSCAHVMLCKFCDRPLILHGSRLVCHQCGRKQDLPVLCPACKRPTLKSRGMGTERITLEVQKLFPSARVAQVDTDTIKTRNQYHEIYEKIHNHEIDVIVGTQMIAQGLDIPNVQLIGVIQCDNALNLPDFHSEERVFQLLTQVAGRAGRRKKQGEVIIQTFFPLHPVFESVKEHSFQHFFDREILHRKNFHHAPFTHRVVCIYEHRDEQKAEEQAKVLADILTKTAYVEVLGPSPAFITKRRGKFRWQLHIRVKSLEEVPFDIIPNTWDIYVDPQNLLL